MKTPSLLEIILPIFYHKPDSVFLQVKFQETLNPYIRYCHVHADAVKSGAAFMSYSFNLHQLTAILYNLKYINEIEPPKCLIIKLVILLVL